MFQILENVLNAFSDYTEVILMAKSGRVFNMLVPGQVDVDSLNIAVIQTDSTKLLSVLYAVGGWGLRAFLNWWPPSTMWAGPLIFLWPPPGMSE